MIWHRVARFILECPAVVYHTVSTMFKGVKIPLSSIMSPCLYKAVALALHACRLSILSCYVGAINHNNLPWRSTGWC
ncbi:unnamed protein product [Dicrocoelium dendriticum]|nr:unnamed protein product [Dicrocoelium dendriticum]